jgi:hypothetical protein
VNPADPNVQRVELVAAALGDLRAELVLVGGCAASLLIDAPTALPPRVTFDVDLIAEVAALRNYHALEEQFTLRGFKRDVSPEAPICRWRLGDVEVDLMPTDETVLGFEGRQSIEAEVSAGEPGLRAYLAAQFARLAALPDFQNVLPGLVAYDELHSRRVEAVMKKVLTIAALRLP